MYGSMFFQDRAGSGAEWGQEIKMQKMNVGMDNEYIRIDLLKIVKGMMRRAWIIVLAMIVCGVAALSYAAFIVDPMYSASVSMYVNNSSLPAGSSGYSISSSEISAAKSLVDTYLVILKTRTTLNEVIERGSIRYPYESLSRMITAESINGTEVFDVVVTCGDPAEAMHIANTIADVLPGKIAEVVEGSSVRIVDRAAMMTEKVSPSLKKYTVIGLLLGMMLSCGTVAMIEILDDKIRTEDYLLENYPDIPLLTVIPDLLDEQADRKGYSKLHDGADEDGEAAHGRNRK